MKAVIADTSCLILYQKINGFHILKNTFNEIIITKEVEEEYGLPLPGWFKIKPISDHNLYLELRRKLGKGEASSIVLANEMENCLLIIDEKRGRNLAEEMSLRIIGSLGVILKAKQKGVIPSAKEIIAKIEKTNFRISNSLKADLLRRVNEL